MVAVVMDTGLVVVGVVLVVVVVVVFGLQSDLSHLHIDNEHVLFFLHAIMRQVLKQVGHKGLDDCPSAAKGEIKI